MYIICGSLVHICMCICTLVIMDACADSSAHLCVLVACMYSWSMCAHVHVKAWLMLYLHIRPGVCVNVCLYVRYRLSSSCSGVDLPSVEQDSQHCYTETGGC